MPAGASLISPWVDLTHSFPSITEPAPFDYVPSHGFHAKPSLAWPPPTPEERQALGIKENQLMQPDYVVEVDGEPYTLTDQVNMYAPNIQLTYPLVSPIHAASLGGLCPCQVVVGGGELLRDEQVYLAHKMANPTKYPVSSEIVALNKDSLADIDKFPPTDVELLVFDDGPHAAPTLGHIDIAKHQYRAVSQFAAWALARAQGVAVEIEDYRGTRTPSSRAESGSVTSSPSIRNEKHSGVQPNGILDDVRQHSSVAASLADDFPSLSKEKQYVSLNCGDALPPFEDHMSRYRVDRRGKLYHMEPSNHTRALQMPIDEVGRVKGEALKGWIRFREELDAKFAAEKRKSKCELSELLDSLLPQNHTKPIFTVFQKRQAQVKKGYIPVPNGETPPPSALVGRRVVGDPVLDKESGASNGILSRLFRRMEKGGIAADGRKDTMEVCEENRASRVVQPDHIRT